MKFVVPSLTKGLSSSLYPSFECLVGADLGLKGALAVASFYELVYELFHQLLVRALEPQTPCNGARKSYPTPRGMIIPAAARKRIYKISFPTLHSSAR